MSAGDPAGPAPRSSPPSVATFARPALAVIVRPWLWAAAVAELFRLAAPRWWRRWPPLPLPDGELWRFRMETAYGGSGDHVPSPHDAVRFVGWCAAMRRWRRQ